MKITYEKVPASAVRFTIEVPADDIKATYDKITREVFRTVQVPGFRKGKAPKELALRYAGTQKIQEAVFQQVLEDSFSQALKQYPELKIIGNLRTEKETDIVGRFNLDSDFTYQILADVQPEVKLGQYKGFTLKVNKTQPDFASIDQRLRQYQVNKSTLVPIEDRPAQLGDVVIIDVEAFDVETNTEIPEMRQEDWDYDLDENTSLPEMTQAILGAKVGDMVEARIEPSAKFPVQNAMRLVITIKDIKHRELPPLDDEFARSISSKQTMAELRQYLEGVEIAEAQAQTEAKITEALMKAIIDQAEIELPESMVEEAIERLVNARLQDIAQNFDPRSIRAAVQDPTVREQLIALTRPDAIFSEKIKLALLEIAKLEQIAVPNELVEKEYQKFLELSGTKPKNPDQVKNAIAVELAQKQVVQFLKEHSTIVVMDEQQKDAPEPSTPEAPEAETVS